jgi:hypothetical protein
MHEANKLGLLRSGAGLQLIFRTNPAISSHLKTHNHLQRNTFRIRTCAFVKFMFLTSQLS